MQTELKVVGTKRERIYSRLRKGGDEGERGIRSVHLISPLLWEISKTIVEKKPAESGDQDVRQPGYKTSIRICEGVVFYRDGEEKIK